MNDHFTRDREIIDDFNQRNPGLRALVVDHYGLLYYIPAGPFEVDGITYVPRPISGGMLTLKRDAGHAHTPPAWSLTPHDYPDLDPEDDG